jgi:hypothetical protein
MEIANGITDDTIGFSCFLNAENKMRSSSRVSYIPIPV